MTLPPPLTRIAALAPGVALSLAVAAVAMGLHFVLTDRGLEEHYPGSFGLAGRTGLSGALVIGSGTLKCVAAFGAVKVLQREGIVSDMVVGCSGGS